MGINYAVEAIFSFPVGIYLQHIGPSRVLYVGIVIVVFSSLSLGSAGHFEDDNSFYMLALVARLLQGAQGATFNTTNRAVLLKMSKTSELAS